MTISVVINTKNAATTLKRALDSVSWANQIVIMDMHSTDETKKIATSFEVDFYSHPDIGFVEPARNAAIAKATSDWVFILDADEEVSDLLKEKILELTHGDATADAYYIPRKNIVFDAWYQHAGWWPDYQLRLFKTGSVTWADAIHSQPKVSGKVDKLSAIEDHAIIHYNYQTIEQFLDRLNRYTTHEVATRNSWEQDTASQSVISSFSNELVSRLFKHRGIDGGIHGVGISFLQAMYEVVVELKVWQQAGFPSSQATPNQEQTINQLRKTQRALNYWIADWYVDHSSGLKNLWWRFRRKISL